MKIRPYSEDDWEAVKDIYNLSKPDELRGSVDLRAIIPLQDDHKMLALLGHSELIVMEEKGKVIGFAGNKETYISWLFVHPDHRRKEVGHKLLANVLNKLSGMIKSNIARNNQAAKKLYESFGFEVEREFIGNFNGYESKAIGISFSLAFILFVAALKMGKASVVVTLNALSAGVAVILAVALFGEKLTLHQTIGVLLGIFVAVLLSL